MMNVQIEQVEYKAVESLRDLYRQEANCQIIRDSMLRRGLSNPYLITVNGRTAGYGGVANRHDPGQVHEFYVLPVWRSQALPLLREFLAVTQATQIMAQTNMPRLLTLLYDCAADIAEEAVLFEDATVTDLPCPDGALFRRAAAEDATTMFAHHSEPVGEWVVEANGTVVATGGFLCHYNPPYGDIFMEVADSARRQGVGSYLVQEVKRVCYEAGKKPAARCDPSNTASRLTLQKAGFAVCGRLLAGKVSAATKARP